VRRLDDGQMPDSRRATRLRRWARWAAPCCAVVAVGSTVVVSVVVKASISEHRAAGSRVQGPLTADVPPYLLTTEVPDELGAGQRAAIREVATGRVVQTIRFPAGVTEFTDLAATGDDRTFYLTGAVRDHWQIFRLHLDEEGRAAVPEPIRHGRVKGPLGAWSSRRTAPAWPSACAIWRSAASTARPRGRSTC
jgi:hypothetical protein